MKVGGSILMNQVQILRKKFLLCTYMVFAVVAYSNCGRFATRSLTSVPDDYLAQLPQGSQELPVAPMLESNRNDFSGIKALQILLKSNGRMDLLISKNSKWVRHLADREKLIEHLLQPAIDSLSKNGGGTVYLRSEAGGNFVFATGDSERVHLKTNVSIEGVPDQNNVYPQISIEKSMGNVFFVDAQSSINVRKLRIKANGLGNYVFSMRRPVNVTLEDIDIYFPKATGFGHISGTNVSYIRCRVYGDNPIQGHGFALAGNDGEVQDTFTSLIDSVAKGFAHPQGGQGVQFRPPLPSYGADPNKLNYGIKVVGGEFSENLVGVWLQGADQALLRGTSVERNAMYGIFIHSYLESAPITPNRVQIENSNIRWNGSNSRPQAGIIATRANVTLLQSSFDGNLPVHVLAEGSNVVSQSVNYYTTLSSGQPYNFTISENDVPSDLKFISSSLGVSLYESIENSQRATIVFE